MTDKEKLLALVDTFAQGNQQRFAEIIGVPRSNIATWLHRGSITAGGREAILDTFPQVSREWLISGSTTASARTLRSAQRTSPMLRKAQPTIHFSRQDLIPFFEDSRASCGILEQLDNPDYPTDYIRLPGVQARAAIKAEGDSMLPTIHDGDICLIGNEILLPEVSAKRIYLIVTSDGQCMFKRIYDEGPAAPIILALSENPDYSPQAAPVAKDRVIRLFPLKFVLHSVE